MHKRNLRGRPWEHFAVVRFSHPAMGQSAGKEGLCGTWLSHFAFKGQKNWQTSWENHHLDPFSHKWQLFVDASSISSIISVVLNHQKPCSAAQYRCKMIHCWWIQAKFLRHGARTSNVAVQLRAPSALPKLETSDELLDFDKMNWGNCWNLALYHQR